MLQNWKYPTKLVNLRIEDEMNLEDYEENGEWTLSSTYCERSEDKDPGPGKTLITLPKITCTLKLQRNYRQGQKFNES